MFEQGSGLKISIPRVSYYVYFLYRNCEIVYIGKTTNPTQRIGAHASTKKFDGAECFELSSESEMDSVESELIMKYQPILNGSFDAKKVGLINVSSLMKSLGDAGLRATKSKAIKKYKEMTGADPITVFGLQYINASDISLVIEGLKK